MTVIAAFLAVIALAGWFPMRHRTLGQWFIPYFMASMTTQSITFPLLIAAALLLAALLASPAARPVGIGFDLLAIAALAAIHVRNHLAGRFLYQSVVAAVGDDPECAPPSVGLFAGLLPGFGRRSSVERIQDVAYGKYGSRNRLDLYRARDRPDGARMPILVQVHGGAWVLGQKDNQALPLMYHLAARGWLCIAVNYRLGPKFKFPAMLDDVLAAVAWIREHAHEYGGDPTFLAVTGGSAGGHLSSLAALVDKRVSAAVPLYGRYDFLDRTGIWGHRAAELTAFKSTRVMPGRPEAFPDVWRLASPIDQVRADAPPFLVIHGTGDTLISNFEAHAFVETLKTSGAPHVSYVELAGIQHAYDFVATPLTLYHVHAVERFLDHHRRRSRD